MPAIYTTSLATVTLVTLGEPKFMSMTKAAATMPGRRFRRVYRVGGARFPQATATVSLADEAATVTK